MKTLDAIKIDQVWEVQQKANLRMQLYMIGEMHKMMLPMQDKIKAVIIGAASESGTLDGLGLYRARQGIAHEWGNFFKEWRAWFEEMRTQAAGLGFGTLAVYMRQYVQPALQKVDSQNKNEILRRSAAQNDKVLVEDKHTLDFIFNPQLQALLDAAQRHIYKDGLQLSQRIWKLDQESVDGIDRVLAAGVANGASAWDIAQQAEQYLGADKDLPRWTRTRLYGLTKKDIASGDLTGLLRDPEHRSRGVSYNALRLARNEIQTLHAQTTDAMMQRMPWIEQEQINLSPSHPVDDECDEVAGGGENGDGVYPKGEIELPIHVQCLCFKTAVQMNPDEFVDSLRGWVDGSQPWPEMDQFAAGLGGNLNADVGETNLAANFTEWAFGDPYKLMG